MTATQKTKKAVTPPSRRRKPAGEKPENLERRKPIYRNPKDEPSITKDEPSITKLKIEPFLTGIQERIADLIGELIVFGGTRRNLDLLCRIAADHEARRIYSSIMEGEPVSEL